MDELNDIMTTREMLDREEQFWNAFALAEKNGANEAECIAAGNRAVDRYDREHD